MRQGNLSVVMAGQAKRDPATQHVACLRDGEARVIEITAALPRGYWVAGSSPGHDE